MCIAAAIVGAGALGAVGSVVAGGEQASGQKAAANTQQDMFNKTQANEQPYMQGGYGAESDLQGLLGESGTPGTTVGDTGLQQGFLTQQFDPNSLNGNPAYEFALQQGGQATRNADTPGVGALSGAALKDLTNFDVGTANQYENQYYNQFQTNQNNIFNRLSAIAGLGQNAAANVGNNGAQLGTGIAQAEAGEAASTAGGIVGATNSLSGGANTYAGYQYLTAGQGYAPGANQNGGTNPVNTSGGPGGGTYVNGYLEGAPGSAEGGPVRKSTLGDAIEVGGHVYGNSVRKYAIGGPVTSMDGYGAGWGGAQTLQPTNLQGLMAPATPSTSYMPPTTADGVPQGVQAGTLSNIANGMQTAYAPPRMDFGAPPIAGPGDMRAMAYGGPVDGPGGPKDDRIPAMLSDGEHVWDAASVNAMGGGNNDLGQARLTNLREMLKRRMH